mmetsp:Transcript_11764/g.30540  ORF Transcript_11764/g.30540 Transcript_11764/m.30540 type:complete len:245 (-) Transcript_11764:2006-2740(-)
MHLLPPLLATLRQRFPFARELRSLSLRLLVHLSFHLLQLFLHLCPFFPLKLLPGLLESLDPGLLLFLDTLLQPEHCVLCHDLASQLRKLLVLIGLHVSHLLLVLLLDFRLFFRNLALILEACHCPRVHCSVPRLECVELLVMLDLEELLCSFLLTVLEHLLESIELFSFHLLVQFFLFGFLNFEHASHLLFLLFKLLLLFLRFACLQFGCQVVVHICLFRHHLCLQLLEIVFVALNHFCSLIRR